MIEASGRDRQIHALARQLIGHLAGQTDIELIQIGAVGAARGPDVLLTAIERLDAALAQLADLASVYGDDRQFSLDPLVLPVAALFGEYLRDATGASWHHPDPDDPMPDDELILLMPDGIAVDLLGVARAALVSNAPNLTAVARGVVMPERPANS